MIFKNYLSLFIFILFFSNINAQNFDASDNPYYWKNKTPEKSSYWQQDIDYDISIYLDENQQIIRGNETIVYTNNSPDTLYELFFNLYQNAFVKGSYLSKLETTNGKVVRHGKWEAKGLGNEILEITVNDQKVKTEVDGTIMKVSLPEGMKPDSKIEIYIKFNTYYSGDGGNIRRRMKTFMSQGKRHFNAAQWYPRLAVYDRKFGWCTDQHLNREFYGDFGNYRVKMDMPANFVVGATGTLQNEEEALPQALKDSLDLSRFWKNEWNSRVSYEIPHKKGDRRKWHFFAQNVHDFAWIAGPHYRIHEKMKNGRKAQAIVLEPHASGWKNATSYTHKILDVFSRDFGEYAYPKMIVADAYDGMEYPMLTMDGGRDPGYRGLLVHEIGHNWFYGMVNNNETYRAMLDEGFTQFLTVWGLEHIDGKYLYNQKKDKDTLGGEAPTARDSRAFNGYLYGAHQHEAPPINVHSDGFNGATGHGGGYGHVYYKTATMLYNLQYVLGDELFLNAMKNYFKEWSFRHPYIEDFRNSVINYTKVDLNWFFDQWIETSKNIDYKVYPLKKIGDNKYLLKLKRKEDMQMPLEIRVQGESGKNYDYFIPNTWIHKETNSEILPRWIGWDNKLNTVYETEIILPETPKYVEIDPSKRLADINQLDNKTGCNADLSFVNKKHYPMDHYKYKMYWKPLVWYNNFDGVKLGVHFDGSYMRYWKNMSFDLWGNTRLGQSLIRHQEDLNTPYQDNYEADWLSFRFSYNDQLNKILPKSRYYIKLQHLDGVAMGSLKLAKSIGKWSFGVEDRLLWKRTQDQFNYDHRPSQTWNEINAINNSIILSARLRDKFSQKWYYSLKTNFRSSFFTKLQYSYFDIEHKNDLHFRDVDMKLRGYVRVGVQGDESPKEVLLNAGQANGEELMDNALVRSVSFAPYFLTPGNEFSSSLNGGRLHYRGGLNMRGYAFRDEVSDDGGKYLLYNQNSGGVINTQLDFQRLLPLKWRKAQKYIGMKTYLFGDAGMIGNIRSGSDWDLTSSPIMADAGVGVSTTLKNVKIFTEKHSLTLRFDMPFYLSHPQDFDNDENFKFRYLIGVDHAF